MSLLLTADDRYCAQNWLASGKRTALILYALTAAGSAFNSAILESATAQLSQDYNVSSTVSSLVTTLNLLGIALGPLLWGPLSELYGRKWTILTPFLIASFFAFGCGAAENFQTILVMRFFQGVFSGGVITNAGGALSDMYNAKERGGALVVYSLSAVGGPLLAPIIGSAIVTSDLTWRWTMYIVGIFQASRCPICGNIYSDNSLGHPLSPGYAHSLRNIRASPSRSESP